MRARGSRLAAVVLSLLLPTGALAAGGNAGDMPGAGAGADVAPAAGGADHVSGTTAMFASAAYPGLGQLLNGAEPKAAIVSAAEALIVGALVIEDRRTRNSLRMYKETGDDDWYNEYSSHYDRRQTLVWWAAVAALYGLADAYVDANLIGFDEATGAAVLGSVGAGEGGEVRFSVSVRF